MDWREHIELNPEILVGNPVIRGTRLSVAFVIERLAERWTEAELLENYPGLTQPNVKACLAYPAERLREDRVYPIRR